MKLYLSSYRIPVLEALTSLIGKEPKETKVALISNAKDYYVERPRTCTINKTLGYFDALGFQTSNIDLRDYTSSEMLVRNLQGYDLIWASGGNTFMLRHEMKRSGFDQAIRELLDAGKVYGGESAGAIVAGKSLHGIEYADEKEFAEEIIWDGIGLVDSFVLPHVGSADFATAVEEARAIHLNKLDIVELTDSQAYIVNGSDSKVATFAGQIIAD